MGKRWATAVRRNCNREQEMRNFWYECTFHDIIKAVKQRYMKPGEVYFERDYKYDNEDSISMHSFIVHSLSLQLGCLPSYDYAIDYAFYNCPFEAEIREMLRPIYVYGNEILPRPDFPTYYKAVLNYQPAEFILTF